MSTSWDVLDGWRLVGTTRRPIDPLPPGTDPFDWKEVRIERPAADVRTAPEALWVPISEWRRYAIRHDRSLRSNGGRHARL